ncbi:MAG: hypothetical protein QM731_05130 [Chitinophagaceae bacterium]
MKYVRVSFTALVAVLAMSFTMQVNRNISFLRVLNTEISDGCYLSVSLHVPDPYGSPWPLTTLIAESNLTLYSTSYPYQEVWDENDMGIWFIPGHYWPIAIYSYWPGTVVNDFTVAAVSDDTVDDPYVECPSPYQTFCCFEVEQDYYDNSKYRVTGVRLKAMQ